MPERDPTTRGACRLSMAQPDGGVVTSLPPPLNGQEFYEWGDCSWVSQEGYVLYPWSGQFRDPNGRIGNIADLRDS